MTPGVSRRTMMTTLGVGAAAAAAAAGGWTVRACRSSASRRDRARDAALSYADRDGWMLTPAEAQKVGAPAARLP